MTETTDIKVLRDKHALALKDLTERLTECNRLNYCWDELSAFAAFSSNVINQLEAERQRADKLESYAKERDSENESIALTVGRLRTELAALRGTQEPVAYLTRQMGCRSPDDCEEYLEVSDKEGVSGNGEAAIPVFTHPPKPVVVLPQPYYGDRSCLDKREVVEALKAAGIFVKDGE